MATKKEKELLMATLRFTPRTYTVEIYGYGGECYMGKVPRKCYEYFKRNNIEIDEYASSWDDNDDDVQVPEEYQPFEPGSPYECDDICHVSGATMDGGSWLAVQDEHGKEVWKTTLSVDDLEDLGVSVSESEEIYLNGLDQGTIVLWGAQGEKGLFFKGTFDLTEPFDHTKLSVSYTDADGWLLNDGVSYGDDSLDNDDYSTNGKWGEHKWIVVGGEGNLPAYDLTEEELVADLQHISDSFDVEQFMTEWFPVSIKPVRVGEYEVTTPVSWPMTPTPGERAEWTGRSWRRAGRPVKITQWRGFASDPNIV